MKRIFGTLGVICALFAVTSCATSYKSNGITGGYTETHLAPDLFRVFFRGNAYTSSERVQDLAMLRAAEVTRQQGYPFFAIVDEKDLSTTSSFTTPGESTTKGSVSFYGNQGDYSEHTTYTPPVTHTFFKPKTGILVQCFKTKPDNVFLFDAAYVEQSLKSKYHIKE